MDGGEMMEEQEVRLIYSNKYIENPSTGGTIHTEILLNSDERPQDSDRVRKNS